MQNWSGAIKTYDTDLAGRLRLCIEANQTLLDIDDLQLLAECANRLEQFGPQMAEIVQTCSKPAPIIINDPALVERFRTGLSKIKVVGTKDTES